MKFNLLFICSLLSLQFSYAQDTSVTNLIVDRVVIQGNEHTKDFVILREMTLKPGVLISQQLLEYDKNRIYSLGLFNEVQLQIIPFSDSVATIVVFVSERWYIYPYPIIGIKDGDWGKLYYGLGLLNTNFRGRNEKLAMSFVVGYDPALTIFYRNPFLTSDGSYYLETRLSLNKIRNKSLLTIPYVNGILQNNFDERHYSFMMSLGKRFGISHTAWVSAGYEVITVEPYYVNSTISTIAEDKLPILGAGYLYDTRDISEYPNIGAFARFSVTKFGLPSMNVDIVRYAADVRKYVPLAQQLVLAGRAMTDIATIGPTPSYNRVYLGYDEKIRGHFNEKYEGESRFIASAELHYTLMSPRYFNVTELPKAFGVWRFGVVASAFADAGTVWFRSEPFALDKFVKGYGIGINFLLPYSVVFRAEYALNEVRQGEFIFDLGSTF